MDFIIRFIPIVGSSVFVMLFGVLYVANKFTKEEEALSSLAIKSIRLTLGLILLLAGNEKLIGLPDIIGPHYLITKLDEYGLGLFGQFIALSQVIIGFILLSNRFGALGDIMALPMFLNILVVTISLKWPGTPLEVSLFVVMNLILLASNWHRIKFLITDDISMVKQVQITRKDVKLDAVYGAILLIILIGIALKSVDVNSSKIIVKICLVALLVLFVVLAFRKRLVNLKQKRQTQGGI